MKILVTGADGQVGREFAGCANTMDAEIEVVGMGRQQLDITQKSTVEDIIESVSPSVVINAAAYTAVDKAETETDLAFAVNSDGPGFLAEVCALKDIPLIQISTDYVFDGKKIGAYLESDAVNPMSVYGESKLQGEQRVQQTLEKHIILRTSWVFGVYAKNFVYTVARLAKQNQELRIVNDQYGCPTSAASIAGAILNICKLILSEEKIEWGVYHFCGSPATNWYEFADAIVENSKQSQNYVVEHIQPIATSEYPTAAERPKNSVLNCDKIRHQFSITQQPWIEGLRNMIGHPHYSKSIN